MIIALICVKKEHIMTTVTDKIVIVTGAGTGIGEQVARDLVEAGAKVALIGRRIEKLQVASRGLPDDRIMLCSCDVSDREAVNTTVAKIIDAWGTVDILINNAGINTKKRTTAEIDPNDWDRVININLTGTFNMVRAVLFTMREQGDGIIINISSMAGVRAEQMAGVAYSASKHGMISFTHNIGQEEWEYGIRATAICPGEVNTPLLDDRPVVVPQERRDRMIQPKDISEAVLFVVRLSKFTSVPELLIKPTYQKF